jgi:hypothetical protein
MSGAEKIVSLSCTAKLKNPETLNDEKRPGVQLQAIYILIDE